MSITEKQLERDQRRKAHNQRNIEKIMAKIDEEKTEENGFISWRFNMRTFPQCNIGTRLSNGVIELQASKGHFRTIWWTKKIPLPDNAEAKLDVTLSGGYVVLKVPIKKAE